jgi:hypothetical protein
MDDSRELGTRDIQSNDDVSGSSVRERPISLNTILSVVANEYRRAILNALDNASENTLAYDTLVERVADRVRDEDTERVSDEQRQRVQIALTHMHLPKMEEARIIDYEAATAHVKFVGDELERDILMFVESYDVHE